MERKQLDHAYGGASVHQPYQLCSKKAENQAAAISLHSCLATSPRRTLMLRKQAKRRGVQKSPAASVGVSDYLWLVVEIVVLSDTAKSHSN